VFEVTIRPDNGVNETVVGEFWEDVIMAAFERSKAVGPLSFGFIGIEVRIDRSANRAKLLFDFNNELLAAGAR